MSRWLYCCGFDKIVMSGKLCAFHERHRARERWRECECVRDRENVTNCYFPSTTIKHRNVNWWLRTIWWIDIKAKIIEFIERKLSRLNHAERCLCVGWFYPNFQRWLQCFCIHNLDVIICNNRILSAWMPRFQIVLFALADGTMRSWCVFGYNFVINSLLSNSIVLFSRW